MYYILPPLNSICLILEKDIPMFTEDTIYHLGDTCKYQGENYVLIVHSHQGKFNKDNWDYIRNYSVEIAGFQPVKPLVEGELVRWNNTIFKVTSDNVKLVPVEFTPNFVVIANKKWMAENLKYDDGEGGIFYNPKNKEYYYTWDAAVRVAKKLGWRVPSDEEWDKACEAGSGIKVNEWNGYEKCSLKEKLNIKLAGYCHGGSYYYVSSYGAFWSVSEYSSSTAWYRRFSTGASVTSNDYNKTYGFSLRLVK